MNLFDAIAYCSRTLYCPRIATNGPLALSAEIHPLSRDNSMSTKTAFTIQSLNIVPCVAEVDSRFGRNFSGLLASFGFAAFLLVSAPALATAVAPPLGN